MKRKNYVWLLPAIILVVVAACKKKNNEDLPQPPVVPTLTTNPVSNITTNSAVSGGTIISDGDDAITASGICYSSTVQVPTIAQDTTKGTVGSGSFTAALRNLQSGITWYVRAYAINSVGVAYGNVVSFNSANAGPEAKNVFISGTVRVPLSIRARYTYFDAEGDLKGNPAFQWYIADDSTTAGTPIAIGTDSFLSVIPAYLGKFLKVAVTPKALTGTLSGVAAHSIWIGPIGPPETVTFTYNGQQVTYGVITSPETGRKWLDRNLGASDEAVSHDDWQHMGDLFQWGRGADGHQLIVRRPPGQLHTGVNGVTTTLSNGDNPGHSLFITPAAAPFNWRSSINTNLWQVNTGINNVCPAGWHVPTKDEWEAEHLGKQDAAYTQLKITTAGFRNLSNGNVSMADNAGRYWTSTTWQSATLLGVYSGMIVDFSASYTTLDNLPANGLSVRCIKD